MKRLKELLNRYFVNITDRYDVDMNLIEGFRHKEFNVRDIYYKPNKNELHKYHVEPFLRNRIR